MELLVSLRFYLHQDDPKEISSKYEWEILDYLYPYYIFPNLQQKEKEVKGSIIVCF